MSRLLITGGCGFIGSNFVQLCLESEDVAFVANVDKIVDISNSRYCHADIANYKHYAVDLNNQAALLKILQDEKITDVAHFAAMSHVDDSFKDPGAYVDSNVKGTLSLLSAMQQYGKVTRFLHVSTDEIYGDNREGRDHMPDSPTHPQNPYSASKAGGEALARAFSESFGLPLLIVRANNNYGQYQYPDKVMGRFICQLLENEPITIHGSGAVKRSFIHVSDCCRAIYTVLKKGEIGQIYNIGSADEIKIIDLAHKLKEMIGGTSEIKHVKDRVKNDLGYRVDASKLLDLGWTKQVSFEDGLQQTIDWFRENKDLKCWTNKRLKFLVYGGKGWIGEMVVNYLKKHGHILIVSEKRLENSAEIEQEISDVMPSHVISLAGRTSGYVDGKYIATIDYLEKPGKWRENVRDNLFAPVHLALLCQKLYIHFTYLGTGCIYLYDEVHAPEKSSPGFTETDPPNFDGSAYSYVKGFTDTLLNDQKGVLNCRIRMPIDNKDHPRNFVTKITSYKKICSIPNSMTVLPEFIPIIVDMCARRIDGTFNLTNPGRISHNEILEMYKCHVNPQFEWENFTDEEMMKILLAPRSNNFLETEKLQKMYPEVRTVHQSVVEVMKNYNKSQ